MELTEEQKQRIEDNRKKALLIRQEKSKIKPIVHPYEKCTVQSKTDKNKILVTGQSYVDTDAGFLLDEDNLSDKNKPIKLALGPNPIIQKLEQPTCIECHQEFGVSYLMSNFNHPVCDRCKEKYGKDKFELITRTEAKKEYVLKDCDIDLRPPPLKYILSKNPHNSRWGEMKLYLLLQIEKRALEVWGSEEEVERQIELKQEKQKAAKLKTHKKRIKELRMTTRSSLYTKVIESHVHKFTEIYNKEEDNFQRSCDCGFQETFEKM